MNPLGKRINYQDNKEKYLDKEKSLDNSNYVNHIKEHKLFGNLRSLYLTRNVANNMSDSWYNIKNNEVELEYGNIYYKNDNESDNEKMY